MTDGLRTLPLLLLAGTVERRGSTATREPSRGGTGERASEERRGGSAARGKTGGAADAAEEGACATIVEDIADSNETS